MFTSKQTVTFIHGKQKSGYRNNKSPTTEILSLVLLFFPLSQEIWTNILPACVHIDSDTIFLYCCLRIFFYLMTMMVLKKKNKKGKLYDPTWECVVFLIPPKNPKGAYPKTLKVHASPLESFITILVYVSITSLKNEVLCVIHNSSSLSFAADTRSPSAWQTYLLNLAAMGWLSRWLRGQTIPHSPGKCQHTELHRFSNCTPVH